MAKAEISVHARPDRALVLALLRRGIWSNRGTRTTVIASVFGPLLLPVLFRQFDPDHHWPPLPSLAFLLIGPFFIVLLFVVAPRRALGSPGVRDLIEHGVRLRLSEAGVWARSRAAEGQLGWDAIARVTRAPGAYLLEVKDSTQRFVVPQKDFASRQDEEDFRTLVSARLGTRARLD